MGRNEQRRRLNALKGVEARSLGYGGGVGRGCSFGVVEEKAQRVEAPKFYTLR